MEKAHWKIQYNQKVDSEDIPRIDTKWWRDIEEAIRQKLGTDPFVFGKPLRHSLKGVRALRVGDYRVLYEIRHATVYIGAIKHRSFEYQAGIEERFA